MQPCRHGRDVRLQVQRHSPGLAVDSHDAYKSRVGEALDMRGGGEASGALEGKTAASPPVSRNQWRHTHRRMSWVGGTHQNVVEDQTALQTTTPKLTSLMSSQHRIGPSETRTAIWMCSHLYKANEKPSAKFRGKAGSNRYFSKTPHLREAALAV